MSKSSSYRTANFKKTAGVAFTEFAITFPIFLFLIFAVIEFSVIAYAKLNTQFALTEAARYMVTGQGLDNSNTPNPNARLTAIKSLFCTKVVSSGFPCNDIDNHFTVSCVGGCTQAGGGPGQTVTLTASYTKTPITSIKWLPITITAKTTWKNESFL